MSSQPDTYLSAAEYLEIERRAEYRSEYYQGRMFAMSGASRRHGLIAVNLAGELRQRLKGKPCEVYTADLRVRVTPTGLFTYPDVLVVCGEPQFADDQKDTLLNPVLIIEVLSESTRDYDRGGKFQHYRSLASLREYVTVAQDAPHVERHTRQPDNAWLLTEFDDLTVSLQLTSAGCEVPLAEIYDRIEWSA